MSSQTILILLILCGSASAAYVITDNVAYKRVATVTTSESRWLVTLILETSQYDRAIEQVLKKIAYVENVIVKAKPALLNHLKPHLLGQKPHLSWFSVLTNGMKNLRTRCQEMKKQLDEYRSMHTHSMKKRSLLPFVGGALSFLFGSIDEQDFNRINENVQKLEQNQKSLIHVVEESLSIVNATRSQVSNNLDKINEVIRTIGDVNTRMRKITETLQKEMIGLEAFIETYLQLLHVETEMSNDIDRLSEEIQNFGRKIDTLALGRLTPNVITPNNFQSILFQIKSKLSHTQGLPEDPRKNLWKFFEFVTLRAAIRDGKIYIFINLPIITHANEYEIYRVMNLPLSISTQNNPISQTDMTVHYRLESEALAINLERTKFILLTNQELESCSKEALNFCAIKSPAYFANKNSFCITALFLKNQKEIENKCQATVSTLSRLPQATYIARHRWAISTRTALKFSEVCPDHTTRTITVEPPLSILAMNEMCSAFNDYLSLPASVLKRDQYDIIDPLPTSLFAPWEKYDFKIMEPIVSNFGNLSEIKIPKRLEQMKEIPMGHLIDELKNAQQLSVIPMKTSAPLWVYIVIIIAIIVSTSLAGTVIWLVRGKKVKKVEISAPTNFRQIEEAKQTEPLNRVTFNAATEELDLEFN